ncbi:hypothetical protein S7711_03077 [Stachybotrys chartarum IBT 7711]|uniref:Uncharacterized protein n=1 Tax=Stachybotrys chartarum (strain CBS 109288 / IBT 7711) TaxID=1280523 RepID=A0A084B890_STACB|nr:hypothetical protein S7711_03077 [Stachybotrys chartarum IBT 7711]KFA54079.1 hypothetical protein S40293_05545 [Stachybotrys chartarum IBT 40293]
MSESNSKSDDKQDHGEQASTGDKHQTEHESPEPKRTKTKQTTLDEHVSQKPPKTEEGDKESEDVTEEEQPTKANGSGEGAEQPGEEPEVPSNILEKGIIYFFIRGRINIQDPSSVGDIARTYMLLRPIANDAKLGLAPLSDAGNTRLIALPKKTLPASGRDRFMTFVEKSGASYDVIKKEFLDADDYETKTAGTRHTPAATPVGEGVYAITTTGRESHLVYMTTLPETLGEVQQELGLKEKGSFILSTKNPAYPGPANAQLPQGPEFSKEIMDEFRSLRWMPTKPSHLDFPNAQILLIGESSGIDKAVEPQDDQKKDEEDPVEALEHLEEEDLKRMKHLPGDMSASIFADLHARAKDYPKLQTTF